MVLVTGGCSRHPRTVRLDDAQQVARAPRRPACLESPRRRSDDRRDDLCEHLHHKISRLPGVFGSEVAEPTRGITGFVYRSIRGVTRGVGGGVDRVLSWVPEPREPWSSPARESLLAVLNGVIGDHLAATGNPLGIGMSLRSEGRTLELEREALARDIAQPSGRIVVLAHGLCMNDLQWRRNGHDHGAALERDARFTPVYLHYNSGLHISSNGRAFSEQLEALVRAWPVEVEELVLLGYSMGGLVARSACHQAAALGHEWPRHLRRIVFLGTPHAGSPLERNGNRLDAVLGASPYTSAFARLGKLRSAGITDLRHANLVDNDWQGCDRFARGVRAGERIPLPSGVACYAIAGTLSKKPGGLRGAFVGDGLVPVASALGRHARRERSLGLPESRQWIGHGIGHLDLLDNPHVYARVLAWLAAPRGASRRKPAATRLIS